MVSSLSQAPVPVATVIFSGERVTRFLGRDLTGVDWFSLVDPAHLPERTRRTASVAGGALLKTIREVRLKSGGTQRFEMISVPLRPDADGMIRIFNYLDLPATAKNAVLADLREVTTPPVRAEFVPIPLADASRAAPGALQGWMTCDNRRKMISQASVRFVINFMREAMKTYAALNVDPTDYLIILTIDTQNVAHVHDDPKISMRYAVLSEPGLDSPRGEPGGSLAHHPDTAGDRAPAYQPADPDGCAGRSQGRCDRAGNEPHGRRLAPAQDAYQYPAGRKADQRSGCPGRAAGPTGIARQSPLSR